MICVDFLEVSNAISGLCLPMFRLCPSGLLLFPGNEAEWPMFCRNVDSFPFRQISGSRFVHFFSKGHAEIFREFRHDLCYKLGHIECLGFAAPGRSQRSQNNRPFLCHYSFY